MKTYILIIMLVAVAFAYAQPYSTVTAAGVTLNYRVTPDLQNLDCQLIATTTGWVAVGFNPTQAMQNANFIIGFHDGGTFIRDDFGVSSTSHASDISLGGTDDIVSTSSSETAGVTQLNFVIPLISGDSFDGFLVIGQTYPIILGRGFNGGDSFTASHAQVGSASITLTQPVSSQDDVIPVPGENITLNLSPNPFTSSLNIRTESKDNLPVNIRIFDVKGREIDSFSLNSNTADWNTDAYHAGVYFIQAVTSEGSTLKKVLKIK